MGVYLQGPAPTPSTVPGLITKFPLSQNSPYHKICLSQNSPYHKIPLITKFAFHKIPPITKFPLSQNFPHHKISLSQTQGGKRVLWVSTSNDLRYDAVRDLADLNAAHIPVHPKV